MAAPEDTPETIGNAPTVESTPDDELGSAASLLRGVADAPGRPIGEGGPLRDGQLIAGKYRIERAIGEGGMGVVYRARDTRLDRDVAIKVGSAVAASALARMEREAQALAKLSHPNVVVVYEVGEVDGRVFVAMEHVAGGTARAWLAAERSRPARAIVALFCAAGDGLAAAHAAGIVHRDFKPDNVLVGDDGRPRVADFGLATSAAAAAEHASVAGTPAYMAPEQLAGAAVDARADQFAFCAALWEALHGTRPFPGTTPAEVAAAIESSEPRMTGPGSARPGAPHARAIPRHVDLALRRGLRAVADERWPALAPLLAELRRDPARRRRNALLAAGAVVAIAAAAIVPLALRSHGPAPCTDDAAALASTWNDARAGAIGRALASAGGAATWRDLRPRVDRYAGDWIGAHHDACKATRVDGAQSDAMLDHRMLCLDRARAQLDAILVRLAAGGRDTVVNAPQALGLLPELGACANAEELAKETLPPRDPAVRAKIDAAVAEVVKARTAAALGGAKDGPATGLRLVAGAEATGWPPLVGDARHARAELLLDAQEIAAGRAELEATAQYALRNNLDALAARCMIDLGLSLVGDGHIKEATPWIALARSLWSRLGEPPQLGASVFRAQTAVDMAAGDNAAALADVRTQVTLAQRYEGEDPADHYNLANVDQKIGKLDDAAKEIAVGLALVEQRFGKDHPMMVEYLRKAAEIALDRQRNPDVLAFARRAIAVGEAWYGPDDVHLAGSLRILGGALSRAADYTGARAALDRAIAILQAHSPDSSDLALIEFERADIATRTGDYAAAADDGARVLASVESRYGADSPFLVAPLELLGIVDRHLGRIDASAQALERAIAIGTKTNGPGYWETLNDDNELSYTRIAQGRVKDALALLEASRPLVEAGKDLPGAVVAEWHQAYADALWRAGGDHARARASATTARDDYAALGADYDDPRRQSEAWLASHR